MIALDIEDGSLTWEVTVAQPARRHPISNASRTSRGSRSWTGPNVCAAAFQAKVACFEIQSRNQLWSLRPVHGLPLARRHALRLRGRRQRARCTALDKVSGADASGSRTASSSSKGHGAAAASRACW
jgi:hypothetical protein